MLLIVGRGGGDSVRNLNLRYELLRYHVGRYKFFITRTTTVALVTVLESYAHAHNFTRRCRFHRRP